MHKSDIWVGFTGTRKGITKPQTECIVQALTSLEVIWFVHGGAKGGDRTAHYLAFALSIKTRIRPAVGFDTVWLTPLGYGPLRVDEILPEKPPLERNRDIVNDVQYMLACPFGFEEEIRSGTWGYNQVC